MTTSTADLFVNYYEILNVSQSADSATLEQKIKEELRTWRKRQASPDLSKRQEAELRVQHLSTARQVLLDATKRAAFDRTLAAQPTSSDTGRRPEAGRRDWLALTQEYLAQNDYHSAAYAAREATQQDGDSALAWNLRARANGGLGHLDDATYEARQAAELEPTNPQYQFDLGGLFEQRQQWDDALSSYQTAARLDPATFLYPLSVAGVYLQNDAPKRALPLIEEIYRDHPGETIVNYYLASCLVELAEGVPGVRQGNKYWITSAEEIRQMRALLERAMRLPYHDTELKQTLDKTLSYVDDCERVKFSVPPALLAFGLRGLVFLFLVVIMLVFGGFSALGSGSVGAGLLLLLLGGGLGFLLVRSCWVPVWKQNKRLH